MTAYKVEHSEDGNEVCIIPEPTMSIEEIRLLVKLYSDLGYNWWVASDERRGYTLAKIKRES